ncbi:aldose epimerase family protein [Saccharicrinis aurantiacus]|uniref:aldose epimerase family protein n=1 Tax=Saccharicrinis aurantiacus TaxID=1849719 RepID=UPI00094F8818|nr:aldose epimerase family protein [Saccharicrinis aurantiacus]
MKVIDQDSFKGTYKGKEVALFTLKNKGGMVAQVTNFGAKIVSVLAADRDGNYADVVQGYETIEEWFKGMPYFGAVCGRFANRIKDGKFTIDGVDYQLPINNGTNSLHGGPNGFNDQVFDVEGGVVEANGGASVKMSYVSVDGEEGYPGTVKFSITYTLTEENELVLDYYATTDKTTHVNICSHSFFNLEGVESGSTVTSHELMINAKEFTPYDDTCAPTGEIRAVKDTPMDFTETHVIGDRIDADYEQLQIGVGYDHNWILDKGAGELGLAAVYSEPKSGRGIEVYTTQPGIQVYTANWHDGSDVGKGGVAYQKRSAICLETQGFPNSPNKENFPSSILKPGEEYKESCVYKFVTK